MTRTHEIKLDGYGAHTTLAEDRPIMLLGTAESYGIEMLHVVSGKSWEGLTITATFNAPDGTSTDMLINAEGNITVPPEATVKSGSGRIVFTGVSNGIQRISCDLDYFVVAHSAINGVQSGGTAPSWFEQAVTRFMPSGGTSGQVLTKNTDADFDAEWQDSQGGAGLKPLVGTTQTITPSQVLIAIKEGRDIALQYTDSYYGTFVFSAFNANEKLGIVVSNSILPQMNGLTGTLLGFVEDAGWIFKATNTATKDDVGTAVNEALAQAKASGEFDGADGITPTIGENGNWYLGSTDTGKPSRGEKGDKGDTGATGATGADGKSAYSYAQDGGYTGTEAEFAAKLAAEKLPNPYPLTFTGAVSETYDGSSAKTITIPSGGGGSGMNLSLVYENTFESVAGINETIDALNGKENFVFNIEFTIPSDSATAATINNSGLYNGERHFPIAYYVGYGNYSTSYPKKAAYGSFLKLGEGLWERIRLKAVSKEMFCNQHNLVAGNSIAFQYLKDNQNNHAAGLRIDFNQTMESVKIQIYAG